MQRLILTLVPAGMLMLCGFTIQAQDNEVHERKVDQQKRIANGVQSGRLSPKEASRLENKEAKLNHEIRHDRKENGGNMTNKEKRQVNRQQNTLSKDIYKQKHDNNNR